MNDLLPDNALHQILSEERHFLAAPEAFLQAWKRGVEIAGVQWFGDGTRDGLIQATDKWALRPNVAKIKRALGVMSPSERIFLSALVSVYNAHEGGKLLKRSGFQGLADFTGLDLQRRQVIAELILQYNGW